MPGCWACSWDMWAIIGKAWPRRGSEEAGCWGDRIDRWGGVAGLVSSSAGRCKLGLGESGHILHPH